MVVKERGEIFYPSHEHPGNSGSQVYQAEQGKTLSATYGPGGISTVQGREMLVIQSVT